MARHTMSTWWVLFLIVLPIHAQTIDPSETPAVELQTVTFTQRSDLSTVEAVTTRFRSEPLKPPEDYLLEDESFALYAPPSYDGTEAFGLIVWISTGPQGRPPEEYLRVLDQHRLIWIGADNAGNSRSFWHRAGLALDGLSNITQSHNIDPMRIYISGISEGGRCSARIGLTYADLFAGAFPMIGVDFFKRLPHPDSTALRAVFWTQAFKPPMPRVLKKAKRDGRYVLLTGENDRNRIQTLVTYQYGFKRAQFVYVTYLEVPDLGHILPPANWFEKGIIALDAPLDEVRLRRETKAKRAMDQAMYRLSRSPEHGVKALRELLIDFPDTTYAPLAAEQLQRVADGQPFLQPDPQKPDPEEKAQRPPPPDPAREALVLARNYLQADRADLARDLLNVLIEHHPDSKEAEQARTLLEEMAPP